MRVAIYCYVSTTEKAQDFCGQLIQMREYCEHHGLTIVGEYVDHENEKRKDRVQFQAMLDGAAQKTFDLLLFWALNELTRDGTLATLKYFQKLDGFGISLQSLAEPWIDTAGPLGDTIIRLVASLVKQERARSSERIKVALARAAKGGTRSGRSIGRPRAVLSKEQAVKFRSEGLSWREIARRMGVSKSSIPTDLSVIGRVKRVPPRQERACFGLSSRYDVQHTWETLLPAQTSTTYRHSKLVLFSRRSSIRLWPCTIGDGALLLSGG